MDVVGDSTIEIRKRCFPCPFTKKIGDARNVSWGFCGYYLLNLYTSIEPANIQFLYF
jgi:hypothetical protein